MANGSTGMVIAGVVIAIVLATQADRTDIKRITPPDGSAATADGHVRDAVSGEATGLGRPSQGADGAGSVVPPNGLATPGVINSVDGGRVVALTFSSGPDPEYTPLILDVLDRHGVVATFCMIGEEIRRYPDVVADVAAAEHTLCSQGESQDYHLADRGDLEIQQELRGTLDAIDDVAPEAKVPFFRAPGGGFTPDLNQVAETYGHDPLGWNVDPQDWELDDPRAIVDAVMTSVEPGAVILLHDGDSDRSATVAALDMLIDRLRLEGYQFSVPARR